MAFHERFIAGAETRIARKGSGQPLLCLHGGGGLKGALGFFDRLSGWHDVIAPCHPGFDMTPAPAWLDGVEDMALFYLDLLDALELDRVDVLGLSLGGWIAMEIGIRAPERLSSMTLVGAPGMSFEGITPADNFLWPEEERARRMVHDPDLADRMSQPPESEEESLRALSNWAALARLAWSPRWHDPQLDKWAHRLAMPVQVVWGREDQLFPVAYAEAYAQRLPNARALILEGCGHLLHIEKPEALAAAVTTFAEECAA
jgi:pimeloyl-ACP methyl ester carboxylesterase